MTDHNLLMTAGSWVFVDWGNVIRVVAIGVPAYAALILLLRVSGNRTLSKMNAFDLVITVAFGSTLASLLLSPTATLAQGVTAFSFLIAAQFVITWLSCRWQPLQRLIKASPTMLYTQGEFREVAMQRERVTRVEIEAAARQAGHAHLDTVGAVILETDGSISVLPTSNRADGDSLTSGLK
ncbi:DUF421 domain-containing protein [Phycisphaerales bacterium AB-hyl4]|uniref:DUF421 domain-containing protein n=1 Tax=Natronomicrosphaera hydrolytica TaxID=3242702 RepID=A0ABV4U2P9_9BACT